MIKPTRSRSPGYGVATAGVPSPPENLFSTYIALNAKERQQRFVTTEQAAALANVSRRTVQHWIAEGHVRAVRVAYATISSGPP